MVPMRPSVAVPADLIVADGLPTHPVAQTAGPESAQDAAMNGFRGVTAVRTI